ncbi:cytochrome P450 [Parasphingopyxis sp.]|uniref:cytochrome P450 n=1 Tax=Parasphingopyxis sp. TaxID=1920299 RepID=UPI002614ABDD|nr:cytochrome P450 [Parasphingopyxis sp.]
MVNFRDDPLTWLGRLATDGKKADWIAPDQLCIADAEVGRAVLHNKDHRFKERSDFFKTRNGEFGPRDAQIAIGRKAKAFITAGISLCDFDAIVEGLGAESLWPQGGCMLIGKASRSLLASDERSKRFNVLLDEIIQVRIYDRDLKRPHLIKAFFRRRAFMRAFARERDAHVVRMNGEPRDVLDIVFDHGGGANHAQLAEVFLGFAFSLNSSVGLALSWTLMLTLKHGRTFESSRNLTSESLRLFPVAWLFDRQPEAPIDILGHQVTPQQSVIVSPYAIHRNAEYWPDPEKFLPERWNDQPDQSAWIPFGAGPHSCVAMSLTYDLIEKILHRLCAPTAPKIEIIGEKPSIGVALAPPMFRIRR